MSTEVTSRQTEAAAPLVHAVNVMKAFHGVEVLKGIDLDVHKGQVVCLLGPSGSGKTTFLRCINQLETIDGGRIWVDGDLIGYADRAGALHRLSDKAIADQRRDIGMVFQRFNLFPHMTALENVMEAPVQVRGEQEDGRARARPLALLERVGLGDKTGALPGPALRRAAAARRHRPGARDGSEAHALRRADLRARPRARRRGARRHARARRPGHDDDRRHPRDGLRPRRGRPVVFMDGGVVVEAGDPKQVINNPQHERTRSFLQRMRQDEEAAHEPVEIDLHDAPGL